MTDTADQSPFVVSFDWLEKSLGQPGLKIVNASWYLPTQNRDGYLIRVELLQGAPE